MAGSRCTERKPRGGGHSVPLPQEHGEDRATLTLPCGVQCFSPRLGTGSAGVSEVALARWNEKEGQ